MKKLVSKLKKQLIYFIMFFTLSSMLAPIKVSAATYPTCFFFSDEAFTNQIVEDTCNVGDTYNIRMKWFAKYNNEGYEINIIDNNTEQVVATASDTWGNTSYIRHITVRWDTSNTNAGKYRIEVTPKFYSLYRWNEAPSVQMMYLTLKGNDSEKTDSSIAQIKGLKVKNTSKKSLTVSYNKENNAQKYEIQYSLDKSFKKNVKTKKTSATKYTIKKLKKGKTYYVRVCGINGSSQGKWSSVKKVKIKK